MVENELLALSKERFDVENNEPTAEVLGGMIELNNIKAVLIDQIGKPKGIPS